MSMAPSSSARSKVNLPALLLLISTAVFMAVRVGIFFFMPSVDMSGFVNSINKMQEEQAKKTGTAPPPVIETPQVGRPWVETILTLAGGGFIIFGALKMRNLEMWGVSLAAAIVSIVPCTAPCCCSGIPIGIYALVVLLQSDVKSAFRS